MRSFDEFMSTICQPFGSDPRGSINRAWGVCLISMTILFVASCLEANFLQSTVGSKPIVFAAIWTAVVQLLVGVLGTFVLRRFPTEFSMGVFLGILVVVTQQNFILFATFSDATFNMLNEQKSSKVFAALLFLTAIVYIVFALMLTHFRDQILLAPVDVKSVISRLGSLSQSEDGENVQMKTEDKKDGFVQFDDPE